MTVTIQIFESADRNDFNSEYLEQSIELAAGVQDQFDT